MKAIIICISVHHGSTKKVADTISKELNAKVIKPSEFDVNSISKYDLIGFGSGIYYRKHHKSLLDLADKLKQQNSKKAFIFSTETIPVRIFHKKLKEKLIKKGFNIVGDFNCRGYTDFSILKFFGGVNKNRPNEKDLYNAKEFAKKLKSI